MNLAEIESYEGVIVIRLFGSLSVKVMDEFDSICEEQVKKKPDVIALDCSNLDFIDSTAINHLFKLSHNALNREVKVILFNLNPTIQEIIKITNLDTLLTILSKEKFEEDFLN